MPLKFEFTAPEYNFIDLSMENLDCFRTFYLEVLKKCALYIEVATTVKK